tara:strand:- start:370 stop:1374 length:1005 start_codon:yes stop_codon:yes gene_type:complete
MKSISKTAEKCLVVTNENKELLGVLSDGDIRKALLRGAILGDSIQNIYNKKPQYLVEDNYSKKNVKKLFVENKFDLIPVVDKKNKVIEILLWENFFNSNSSPNTLSKIPVIIMAGGKGSRLKPFTSVLPKPLIPVLGKPIIQHIIERFSNKGMKNFHVAINYKGKILKAFLNEFKKKLSFTYIEEKIPLGTAGSLSLLEEVFDTPFFVTNCDILVDIDFEKIFNFHNNKKCDITLVASAKEFVIPYGACRLNSDGFLANIDEKPQYDFLINTGLYIVNPSMLKYIPKNKFYHITHLIDELIKNGKKVGIFPIDDDSWVDVGQWAEYKRAINKLK